MAKEKIVLSKVECACGNPAKVGEPVNECWTCYGQRDYVYAVCEDARDEIDGEKTCKNTHL